MGRTVQIDLLDGIFISIQNSFNTIALRVKNVAVQCETMVSLLAHRWNGRSKAINGNLFVSIIILQNVANLLNSSYILVISVHSMQRVRFGGRTIRKREVNRDGQPDLAATKDELQEGGSLDELKMREFQLTVFVSFSLLVHDLDLSGTVFKLSQVHSGVTQVLVLARLFVPVEFNAEVLINVAIGDQVGAKAAYVVPLVGSLYHRLDFRLIDRLPIIASNLLHNNDEAHT